MSNEDNHPTQTDNSAREVFPVTFLKEKLPPDTKDWRPSPLPASAPEPEEKPVPKVESVPASVESSESPTVIEEPTLAPPAQTPAVKATTPSKASPGAPVSASQKTTGKS